MKYIRNILIALDQATNTIIGGEPDETISAKIYRMANIDSEPKYSKNWKILEHTINLIFFDKNHCKDSFTSEENRSQISSTYKK